MKAQKAAVRSTRAKPAPAEAIAVDDGAFKAPAWLKGEGLAIWQKRAPYLRAQNLLKASDELAFARYCRNFADWLKARNKLDKAGMTYDASTVTGGKLRRVDPLFMVADRLERMLLAVEDRFGMNPAERQRLVAQRAAGAGGRQGDLPLDPPIKAGDPATPPANAAGSPIGILADRTIN